MNDRTTLNEVWSRLEALGAVVRREPLTEDCIGAAIAAARQRLAVLEGGEGDGCHEDTPPTME